MWEDSRRQEDSKNTRQRYKGVIKWVTILGGQLPTCFPLLRPVYFLKIDQEERLVSIVMLYYPLVPLLSIFGILLPPAIFPHFPPPLLTLRHDAVCAQMLFVH